MTALRGELSDYVGAGRSAPMPSPTIPPTGKQVAIAVAAVAAFWVGIAAFTASTPHHLALIPLRSPPASSGLVESVPSSPTATAEYIWADRPTAAFYSPSQGVRYSAAHGTFATVSATITRNGPGDYTVDFHDFGAPGGVIQATAYGGPSSCYYRQVSLPDNDGERVRVTCVTFAAEAPWSWTLNAVASDSRFTVSVARIATS
jgi:hypothetical protein